MGVSRVWRRGADTQVCRGRREGTVSGGAPLDMMRVRSPGGTGENNTVPQRMKRRSPLLSAVPVPVALVTKLGSPSLGGTW